MTAAIERGYRALKPSWDEGTEDKIFRVLIDVFRHKAGAGAELEPIKPTVSEIVASPRNRTYHLLLHNPDFPGYGHDDIIECTHAVPEVEALLRQMMVLHNQFRWDRERMRVIEVGKLADDDFVVVYHPRNDEVRDFIRRVKSGKRSRPPKPPALAARQPAAPYPPVDVRKQFKVMPRLEALAVYQGERPCTNDDLIRNAAYSWSPMTADEIEQKTGIRQRLYTDLDLDHMALLAAQAALDKAGRRPEAIGAVIVWPNPDFDNNITVYGPEVKALVKRYLTQMIRELSTLPNPDGGGRSLLQAIDLIVPHQANKTMVVHYAKAAGLAPEQLYFNIERVGNTSSASIPLAIYDAVQDGRIDRPMRLFAPGFGAGAVGGYVVMRLDPAIVAK